MPKKDGLTDKQRLFCDAYLKDANATKAALAAGYSPKRAKEIGYENLTKPHLRAYIDEHMASLHKSTIMDADEVLQRLTAIARGQMPGEVVVVEGKGEGYSEARRMDKLPDAKEQTKALELLGRRYGLFSDKIQLDGAAPVMIVGDDKIAD